MVIHGLRGRRSNRAKASQMRGRALKRAREPVFEGFGPTLLAEHLSRDAEIGPLKAGTLRKWMIEEGAWKPKRRRARHRKARARRAAFGELIQWDSSEHAWSRTALLAASCSFLPVRQEVLDPDFERRHGNTCLDVIDDEHAQL